MGRCFLQDILDAHPPLRTTNLLVVESHNGGFVSGPGSVRILDRAVVLQILGRVLLAVLEGIGVSVQVLLLCRR